MKKWVGFGTALALLLMTLFGCNVGDMDGGKAGSTSGTTKSGETGNTSDDASITRAVQAKLDADVALKAAGIQAKATGGQVELTGTVKAIADKEKAETIAQEAIKPYSSVNAGVVNKIQIAEAGGASGSSDSGTK